MDDIGSNQAAVVEDSNDKDTGAIRKNATKSAIQLIKNIEQAQADHMKVCYPIVARQQDFLEKASIS